LRTYCEHLSTDLMVQERDYLMLHRNHDEKIGKIYAPKKSKWNLPGIVM